MIRFLFIITLALVFSKDLAKAQDYQVYPPPDRILANQIQRISIVCQAELEFGKLPKHPKITWLGVSDVRMRNNSQNQMQTNNQIEFIANAPGLIEFPPIPIVLENKEFFVRLENIEVLPNNASNEHTIFEVTWNNQPSMPKTVHIGEAVDITFYSFVQDLDGNRFNRPYFAPLSSRVEGGQWHQYTRQKGRKPVPSDFFLPKNSGGIFSQFRDPYNDPSTYTQDILKHDGKYYSRRVYSSRLYFTKLGTVTGHLSATLGTSSSVSDRRTHLIPFEIEVLPIPPLPKDEAIDTGLIGDWEFTSHMHPLKPRPSKPLEILVGISGLGNPDLRNQLDLSSHGFPSVKSNLTVSEGYNSQFWTATFQQTLLPTNKVGTLSAINLAWFDTVSDTWKFHEVTPTVNLPGFDNVASSLTPRTSSDRAITRPVLLNLPTATFGAFALAPFLPFLFGYFKKRRDARDPAAEERARILNKLITQFQSDKGSPETLDQELLPILRAKLNLPDGATAREIADSLAASDPELAQTLRDHAESTFSTTAKPVNFPDLARQLSKLTFLLLFTFTFQKLPAATLEEANEAFTNTNYTQAVELYQELIKESPNSPDLYLNLAQTHLSANRPAHARAAAHTSLLLNPLDKEARLLMKEIRSRQGDSTVGRARFLDLRPDQWVFVAAIIWVVAFLYFAIRKIRPLPKWPGFAILALSLLFIATAAWRQTHDYAAEQYMVLSDELPRELTAGTPNWDYPPHLAGQIIRVAETNKSHARIETSDSSYWLPIKELQQVW